MMLRPTLLLCCAVVIAAVPVWADKISDVDVAKESPAIETPLKAAYRPDLNLNAFVVDGFPAEATQTVVLIDDFETNGEYSEEQPQVKIPTKGTSRSRLQAIASVSAESLPEFTPELVLDGGVPTSDSSGFWGLWFSQPKNRFFRSLPDTNIQAVGVSQVDSYKAGSLISHVWESWRTEGRGSTGNYGNTNLSKSAPVPAVAFVTEPGSLSLLLLGLAAVGFSGRRRGQSLIAV
jgi:hypothetical protein